MPTILYVTIVKVYNSCIQYGQPKLYFGVGTQKTAKLLSSPVARISETENKTNFRLNIFRPVTGSGCVVGLVVW